MRGSRCGITQCGKAQWGLVIHNTLCTVLCNAPEGDKANRKERREKQETRWGRRREESIARGLQTHSTPHSTPHSTDMLDCRVGWDALGSTDRA